MKIILSLAFAVLLTAFGLSQASSAAHQPHLAVIASFVGKGAGFTPLAGVTFGPDGTMYGTTTGGGTANCKCGTVFSLRRIGGVWTLTTLHSFRGGSDGAVPGAPVLVDSRGVIYGTTIDGGGSACSCGTVFKLTPNGSRYAESILYHFSGGADGGLPSGGLIADSQGDLYGLAGAGGSSTMCQMGCGVAFELVRSGSKYTESVIHDFAGGTTDGASPAWTTLVADPAGDLFGTTIEGGSMLCDLGCGTAFELKLTSHGYHEVILHIFGGAPDGARPYGGPIFDVDGALYGTTEIGGDVNACPSFGGCGTVYKLAPNRRGFSESVVYSFVAGMDAYGPMQGLAADSSGALYGASPGGGFAQIGVLFKLTPAGSGFTETVLHDFHGVNDGYGPYGALIVDGSGRLFGTAISGPNGGGGEVFEFVQ